MCFDSIQKENSHLIPLKLPHAKIYYQDLFELENSFVSKIDLMQISTTFLTESVQLVKNAIFLFENGYFDNAYYSLRQSLETALTMVYLSDLEKHKREKELVKWKEKSKFPMYKQMIDTLEKQMAIFSDVKEKMSCYFEEIRRTRKYLNKYVHKQGFNTFYVSRNHFFNKEKDQTSEIQEFEFLLKSCISAIAVFRLCIDPFPVLLMDEEIYSRTNVYMSDAFSNEFIEKYVGSKNINNYKRTRIYKDGYNYFIKSEKRLPAVLDITKNRYIDKSKIAEILSQIHLLRKIEIQAVVIAMMSEKITKIILSDLGIEIFFTNIKPFRIDWNFTVDEYLELRNKEVLNLIMENVFISTINLRGDKFFIEHNKKFDLEEFQEFQTKVKNKFKEVEFKINK